MIQKKTISVWMACWTMLVGMMVSCTGGNEYESALPEDAALVISVNPVSIVDKSGLSGETGKNAVQRLGDALKSGMQGSGQLIDKIIENPSESGIDFRRNLYFLWNRNLFRPGCWHVCLTRGSWKSYSRL